MGNLTKALTAAAGNAATSLYVEDVFSTYLYTGTGAAQTITNGIDLDGEGGLVWIKKRNSALKHLLYDTERGVYKDLNSDDTSAEDSAGTNLTAFNSDGFSIGAGTEVSSSSDTRASWTFRKAEKFFDAVTFTVGLSTVFNHSLGVIPGCIIIKSTSSASDWSVVHIGANGIAKLNSSAANIGTSFSGIGTSGAYCNCTSTTFDVSNFVSQGQTYVAYLFASDAGGYGDDGSENIIKCGSYVGNGTGTGPDIDLGFEPQWVMVKRATGGISFWGIYDSMRGIATGTYPGEGLAEVLYANLSDAADQNLDRLVVTPTGFSIINADSAVNASGDTYIYIAIRRPMKTPTAGTEVFAPVAFTGDGVSGRIINAGFTVDVLYGLSRNNTYSNPILDRLRGKDNFLYTNSINAEATKARWAFDEQNGIRATTIGADGNLSGDSRINYFFKRATGFFDVVAYTGTGVAGLTIDHNLGVAPELMIVKHRNAAGEWDVYNSSVGNTKYLELNSTAAEATGAHWNNTTPTASLFTVNDFGNVNASGGTYIAYLFASVAGVSKVGSYTGTAATLNVDCGFSAGARFILIKRTDSTGDWYVWDTERGIIAGNDPYLLMNSTAVEDTATDYIDPLSSGFTVTSTAPAGLNASGGTYIFLAIA